MLSKSLSTPWDSESTPDNSNRIDLNTITTGIRHAAEVEKFDNHDGRNLKIGTVRENSEEEIRGRQMPPPLNRIPNLVQAGEEHEAHQAGNDAHDQSVEQERPYGPLEDRTF